ncbi:MAG: hypothetical protein KGZ61_03820 [Sandarakinorhabdus sp.]|nr:hypothetical protein [Sandarakinorhabdus sp.]
MKNAFTYRNVFRGWLIYAALGFVQIASAYVTPAPPPGFTNTPDGWAYRGQWVNGSATSSADLTVAGRRVQIPVYFRVSAANAPQFAARYLFRHPLVAAAGAASVLVPLGLDFVNGQWNQTTQPINNYPISDGFIWRTTFQGHTAPGQTPLQHCQLQAAICIQGTIHNPETNQFFRQYSADGRFLGGVTYVRQNNPTCPAGWIITPAGCVQSLQPVTRPLTEDEFVPLVAPQISPAQVPNIVPNTVPIPVETPTINPEPRTVPIPYTPPLPRPLIAPLADPVMIPNTEPQQWRQPLVQINPLPTVDNPWRMSLNPIERITTSPHGITEPVSDLDPATPTQPSPTSDFCILNPEVLACARVPEFDIPNDEIQTLTEVISYEPEQFLGGGSCPQPVTVNLGGHTITAFDTPLYCQFISNYFRPVLLAIAAFTSMMIVAGGFRSV